MSDSYFVVAHFHYTVFGTVVFAMFAGFYFWWPKFFGRMLNETLGKWHFALTFIGFNGTFLIQHWLGVEGMPRRYGDYLPGDGFTLENEISSAFALVLGVSTLFFLCNVYTHLAARPAGDRRRSVGLGWLAGVGDLVPAAAAQLRVAAPDPLRAARPSTCTTRSSPTGTPRATWPRCEAPEQGQGGDLVKLAGKLFIGGAVFYWLVAAHLLDHVPRRGRHGRAGPDRRACRR